MIQRPCLHPLGQESTCIGTRISRPSSAAMEDVAQPPAIGMVPQGVVLLPPRSAQKTPSQSLWRRYNDERWLIHGMLQDLANERVQPGPWPSGQPVPQHGDSHHYQAILSLVQDHELERTAEKHCRERAHYAHARRRWSPAHPWRDCRKATLTC